MLDLCWEKSVIHLFIIYLQFDFLFFIAVGKQNVEIINIGVYRKWGLIIV